MYLASSHKGLTSQMAEEALKKLEEQLNCSICLDTYTDPKLLQCFHVYCQQCLVPLVAQDERRQLGLTCPTCRRVTPVPDGGVVGLQSAFHIYRLLEIRDSIQKQEDRASTPEGAESVETPDKKNSYCSVHDGKELELYCETCGELICTRCALKGGKHHSHDYQELDQACYKEEVRSALDPLEKQIAIIEKALAQFDIIGDEISSQREVAEVNIHTTFRRLQEVLSARETELIGQLDQVTHSKLKSLAVQRDQVETIRAQLSSCLHYMRESLKPGSKRGALVAKQAKELTTLFQPDILQPSTKADLEFLAPVHMIKECEDCGRIAPQREHPPDPVTRAMPAKPITGTAHVSAKPITGTAHVPAKPIITCSSANY